MKISFKYFYQICIICITLISTLASFNPIVSAFFTNASNRIVDENDPQCMARGGICMNTTEKCCGNWGMGHFIAGICGSNEQKTNSIKCCVCTNWATCIHEGGQCMYEQDCDLSKNRLEAGICAKMPLGVKCCVPMNTTSSVCKDQGGACMDESKCGGARVIGLCPNQPANIKCCINNRPIPVKDILSVIAYCATGVVGAAILVSLAAMWFLRNKYSVQIRDVEGGVIFDYGSCSNDQQENGQQSFEPQVTEDENAALIDAMEGETEISAVVPANIDRSISAAQLTRTLPNNVFPNMSLNQSAKLHFAVTRVTGDVGINLNNVCTSQVKQNATLVTPQSILQSKQRATATGCTSSNNTTTSIEQQPQQQEQSPIITEIEEDS